MQVIVYTKPNGHCPSCEWVKTQFRNAGVAYIEETINEDVMALAREREFRSAPIVIAFPDGRPKIEFCGRDQGGVEKVISASQGS